MGVYETICKLNDFTNFVLVSWNFSDSGEVEFFFSSLTQEVRIFFINTYDKKKDTC